MAEICFDCLNQIEGLTHKKKMYIISRDLDLCEESSFDKSNFAEKIEDIYESIVP